MKRWSVEVEAFGRISIMRIEASTRAEAERIALNRVGLKVKSKELSGADRSGIPEGASS